MAFDITKEAQDTLTPEEKAWFDKQISTASAAAVTQAEEARKKSIPERYEFKFSDNSPLDRKTDAEKIAAVSRELGLTADQAAKFAQHHEDVANGIVARQLQNHTDLAAKWKTDLESDRELGGANINATKANIDRFLQRFAPGEAHEFRKLMTETGYGNHPVWVRIANAIGKAMAEDGPTGGLGGGKPPKKEDHEIAYGGATK